MEAPEVKLAPLYRVEGKCLQVHEQTPLGTRREKNECNPERTSCEAYARGFANILLFNFISCIFSPVLYGRKQ